MILIKYLLKEMFRNQLVILAFLFLVCFCQKLIKMLNLITDTNISICLIFLCLVLNIPEEGKLLVPFSSFIGILATFYRLHAYNEIVGMYACAVNKYVLIKSTFFFSGFVAFFYIIDMGWLSPYCTNYQSKLLYEIKEDVSLVILSEKKFQSLSSKYLTLFSDSVQGNKLKNIFLVNQNDDKDSSIFTIITASQGNVCKNSDGSQLIILEKGIYYRICNKCELCKDFFITNFSQYRMLMNHVCKVSFKKNKLVNHMSIYQLFCSVDPEAHVELHWRLTLLMSVLIMPVITALLTITISYNYLPQFLLAFFLYIIFFLLHTLIRFYVISDKINAVICMWIVNGVYLLIVLLAHFQDSMCLIKYFRLKMLRHNHHTET